MFHSSLLSQHDASHQGHTHVVELLLDRGALVDMPGYSNNTALHEAVAQGSADIVSLLLRHGAAAGLKYVYTEIGSRGLEDMNFDPRNLVPLVRIF